MAILEAAVTSPSARFPTPEYFLTKLSGRDRRKVERVGSPARERERNEEISTRQDGRMGFFVLCENSFAG